MEDFLIELYSENEDFTNFEYDIIHLQKLTRNQKLMVLGRLKEIEKDILENLYN